MSCEEGRDAVISLERVSKTFRIYDKPHYRLLQGLFHKKRSYYRDFHALTDVSLEIMSGETVGIVGRNGAGKSTLLQIICGTATASEGVVRVKGRVAALLELGAGFNPEFTGRDNVYLNAAVLGLGTKEVDRRFSDIEVFAEIGDYIDQPVKTYSSGMFVRLAFAVAIHLDPQILVIDEALSVGDARFQAKCLNRIKELKAEGKTILFVSHDVSSVRSLCDRVMWLDEGRVRMIGDVFPVTAQYTRFLFEGMPIDGDENIQRKGVEREKGGSDQPVNRWGSRPGSILSAYACDDNGERKDLFLNRERINITISFSIPQDVDLTMLAIAFSIKNLKGSDLIVSSTWDQGRRFTSCEGVLEVMFSFDNCLNTGRYLLVAALEDRSNPVIDYYEYIEGSHYFSCAFEQKYFGEFIPVIDQSVACHARG